MSTSVDLSGRVALVTGGGTGIGGAAADVLAAAGAEVVVGDIDAGLADERVQAIEQAGGVAHAVTVDVRDPEQLPGLVAAAQELHGHIDVLVNNVGHYLKATPLLRSDDEHWDALHQINLLHVFRCCRLVAPGMVEQGAGSIINVSSIEGLRGYPPDPVYGAYKAALVHFTRCFALEVSPQGVRVNGIAPDVTQTTQVDYESMVPDELRDRWPYWVPIGRVGAPADNADVILFLASDLSRFVTGHTIPTDGGTGAAGGWFRTERGRWTNRPRQA